MKHAAPTHLETEIEKGRLALLRLITYWLAAASLLNWSNDRPLPRRLGRWIFGLVKKLGQAACFLVEANSYQFDGKNRPIGRSLKRNANRNHVFAQTLLPILCGKNRVTIRLLVQQLEAIQAVLGNLSYHARCAVKLGCPFLQSAGKSSSLTPSSCTSGRIVWCVIHPTAALDFNAIWPP